MIQAFSNRHSIRKYGDDGGKRIFCFVVCVLLLISAGEIAFFRQDDEKWAAEKLGDSRYTMESSGCLVCCITSALVMGGKTEETPFTVNERFSKLGGYDLQGNILWDNLRRYGGCEVEVFNKADEELLLDYLR